MAATAAARRLTEAHRLAQLRIGTQTVAAMRSLAPLLDPLDLDGTAERWLIPATQTVANQRNLSTRLAENYLSAFKVLELGPQAPAVAMIVADAVSLEALVTSLLVTGPIAAKKAMATAATPAAALDTATAQSAAAAMRHALNGGRETTVATLDADREALGWARAASARCCSFCAMLASRGPVYGGDTVRFRAHDGCSCSAEPVYRQDASWPAGSTRYQRLWEQAAAAPGDTGNEFRRLVEAA